MTALSASLAERSPPPSLAAYNTRFLSLSARQRVQWKRKVDNVQHLANQCTIVGVLETHVDGLTAETFFGGNIDGTRRYYKDNIAMFVNDEWKRKCEPRFAVVIPSAMVVLTWTVQQLRHWVVLFHVDAHSEHTRIDQLQQATCWDRRNVEPTHWTAFTGDRNFVEFNHQRSSSSSTPWRTSTRMNAAWEQWLRALNGAVEVSQPEFTWKRIAESASGDAGWTYEVLDVAGTNNVGYEVMGLRTVCRRCDDVPFPDASDHWPMALRWNERRGRKRVRLGENAIVRRPIPRWLLSNQRFLEGLDSWVDQWFPYRAEGFAGIDGFTEGVFKFATEFIRDNVVQAATAEQKLDTCLAAMRLLQQDRLDEWKLGRLLRVDPDLRNIVVVDIDLDEPGQSHVDPDVLNRLHDRCKALAQEAVVDRLTSTDTEGPADPGAGACRNHKPDSSMIQRIKSLKKGPQLRLDEIWDDQAQVFVNEESEVADVFVRAAKQRQGRPPGNREAGQCFLDNWGADFSLCRTHLTSNEIEIIIRDGPRGKRPGPDGVPAEVFQR